MPRLLSLNTYHYRRGGSDAVFLDHDALFKSSGWDTAVMTMHHPRNLPSPWSEYFADEIELGHSYGLRDRIGMAGKVIYSLEAKRKVHRLLDAFPADVAHAHCIYHHLSPSVLVALKERGVPTVMTAHDLKLACPAYKMLHRGGVCERCRGGNLLHMLGNRCVRDSLPVTGLVMLESAVHKGLGLYRRYLDRIVVPSRFYGRKLQEWGWPADKLVYIPNYVKAERFEARFEPGDYFLYFGRLAIEKGVATLIAAARQARVRLVIAGTGPLEQELRALAEGADVEFVGFKGGGALWDLVREARAVVLPSEWYENAPMSILEAYAMGKPVLGARIGGIPELINEGATGFSFPSRDVDALAALLEKVQSMDRSSLSGMGRQARESVAKDYSEKGYFDRMHGLYAALMA